MDMTIASFRELFEVQFMPDTTREIMRNQFRDFCQGNMCVLAFSRRFSELALFSPRDVASDTLRVSHSIHDLRDNLRMKCRIGMA